MSKRALLFTLPHILLVCLLFSCGRKKQEAEKNIAVIGSDTITMKDIRNAAIDTASQGFIQRSLLMIYLSDNVDAKGGQKIAQELSKQLSLRTPLKASPEKAALLLLVAEKAAALCEKHGSKEKVLTHLDSLISSIVYLNGHPEAGEMDDLESGSPQADSPDSAAGFQAGECVSEILQKRFALSKEASSLIAEFVFMDSTASASLDSAGAKSLISDLLYDKDGSQEKKTRKPVRRIRADAKVALKYRSQESIMDTIMKHIPNLKALYKKKLKIFPDMSGKVYVTFSVMTDGSVESVMVKSTEINRREFLDELLSHLKKINYKKIPSDVGIMTFDFPFEFTPEG